MIKIVGDSNGELFIVYNGIKIAKVLDEYTCEELFRPNFVSYAQKEKALDEKLEDFRSNIKEHLEDNIEDYIDWHRIRSEIACAINECLDDF